MKIKKHIRINFFYIIIPLVLAVTLNCKTEKKYSRTDFVLGTICNIQIVTDKNKTDADYILDEAFNELKRLDTIFNANRTANGSAISELENVNRNAGIKPVLVSDELYSVLQIALYFADLSGGVFSPAIGPITKLWNIGTDKARVPDQTEIDNILPLADYKNIQLNPDNKSVFLKHPGMKLDLGGIAKGFAADAVFNLLKKHTVENMLINLGGNILVSGKNSQNKPWKIGLRNPSIGKNNSVMRILFNGKETSEFSGRYSVVTSGNYERFFEQDGVNYHHILSPKTGKPVFNTVNAVSVICKNSIYADALSTVFFILGFEQAKTILNQINVNTLKNDFPFLINEEKISAVFFFNDNSFSSIVDEDITLELIDNSFTEVLF